MPLGHLAGDLQEQPVRELHDVGLVGRGHLPAAVFLGVPEGRLHDSVRAEHRNGLDRDAGLLAGRGVELVGEEGAQLLDLLGALLELDPRVEILGVLAHDDEVGFREAGAHTRVGVAGPNAGVEVELLAERDVDRAVAGADRGGRGPLDGDAALADRVERAVGERVALRLVHVDPGVLEVPLELDSGGLEDALGGLRELRSRAVAGDESDSVS
jgi:hypothetical protein